MNARTPLNRERIAEAALALIDEAGIEKFTMRALGQRLAVDPMAIYHHLPNKEAVYDAIVETLWRGIAATNNVQGEDWQTSLYRLYSDVRQHLLAHPHAVLLLGTRPATTPALLDLIEQTLGHMQTIGLPAQEAMTILDCLTAFTIGKVLGEISQAQQQEKVAAALQTLNPENHPRLLQALNTGYVFAPQTQFERGLRAIIAGFATAP